MRRIVLCILALVVALGSGAAYAATNNIGMAAGDVLNVSCPSTLTVTLVASASSQTASLACKAAVVAPTQPTAPTAAPTAVPAPTAAPAPTAPPVVTTPASTSGIWISQAEILALPNSGAAYSKVLNAANGSWGSPNLSDLNSNHDVLTLAGALIAVRNNDSAMKSKVAAAIMSAIGTESSSRSLEISRNIQGYVLAADIINFKSFDPSRETAFRTWLAAVRTRSFDGRSIISTHNDRPNNWGTHAGAARVIIARYLGDVNDLNAAALVWRGYAGDRAAYAKFEFGELTWQANPSAPVGVNPQGATIGGVNVDGVLPDDQRRTAGSVTSNPPNENYVWEAMQGFSVAFEVLRRAGYDSPNWSNQALKRAATWQFNQNQYAPEGDDTFITYIVNKMYGTSFPTSAATHGKNMGWTEWTHAR
jgi:hypothetical protein